MEENYAVCDDVLGDVANLVLCSDANFDATLKAERKISREKREQWTAHKS